MVTQRCGSTKKPLKMVKVSNYVIYILPQLKNISEEVGTDYHIVSFLFIKTNKQMRQVSPPAPGTGLGARCMVKPFTFV